MCLEFASVTSAVALRKTFRKFKISRNNLQQTLSNIDFSPNSDPASHVYFLPECFLPSSISAFHRGLLRGVARRGATRRPAFLCVRVAPIKVTMISWCVMHGVGDTTVVTTTAVPLPSYSLTAAINIYHVFSRLWQRCFRKHCIKWKLCKQETLYNVYCLRRYTEVWPLREQAV